MLSAPALTLVERRLAELNCPAALARRKVRELAEHHDDLKRDALEEGLAEADAEARADELLGEPATLAEQLAFVLRQSSWWGRHPVIGFCILPPFVILLLMLAALAGSSGIGLLYFTREQLGVLPEPAAGLGLIEACTQIMCCGTLAVGTLLFCRLSRRTVAGMRWTWAACASCAVQGTFFYIALAPHNISVGYSSNYHWAGLVIPLAIGLAVWWATRRVVNEIPLPIDADMWRAKRTAATARAQCRQPGARWLTPSSAIAGLGLLAFAAFITWAAREISHQHARQAELENRIWPAERAAALKEVASRQLAKDTVNETTINLDTHINSKLTDSVGKDPGTLGDDLAQLPVGIHTYGGVPFDIGGRLQLRGQSILDAQPSFPSRVAGISIGRKLTRIYLLHGAMGIEDGQSPVKIAWLVLHYTDGSEAEIAINSVEHLLNWHGPIYKSDVNGNATTAAGAELAWIGHNTWIKENDSQNSLRLYRSRFENPHPQLTVTSVDYVSAMSDAAPFLVGLTVE